MNNLLRDITGYRKSVMRVWMTKDVINDLRSVISLPSSLTLARDTVLSLFEDLPLCKSADPDLSIERLKSYFEMKNPKSVSEKSSEKVEHDSDDLAQQIRLLTQLLIKGSVKANEVKPNTETEQ